MTGKFKQGWEDMSTAFKGMGTEIKEDWKAAGDLADRLDTLEDKEIALINSLEERKAKIAELRLQAKEETEDMNKKVKMLNDAEKLIRSVYGDQISLEKERLAIMKEQLAMQTSDPTDEQRRSVQEQEAKINALLKQQSDEIRALTKERNAANKAIDDAFKKFNSYGNIKIPQLLNQKVYDAIDKSLQGLHHTYIKLGDEISALYLVLDKVSVDAGGAFNDSIKAMSEGLGEFLGNLASGHAGISDFGKLIGTVFADMAINVGKIAIAAGLAVLGIKKALMSMNPYVAIAAGIALVALGYAIKGSLSSAASGGSGGASANTGSNSWTYDNSTKKQTEPIQIHITGELVGKGSDLVSVINYETRRKRAVT
jgi:hypothetical protein